MNPILQGWQKLETWNFPFLSWLDFLFVLRIDIVHCPWNKITGKADSDKLAFQQMSLIPREKRVAKNFFVKISCEWVFYFSCNS